ncbi:MAG: GNAT family N-acetyltransferase [Alphaproteobacteria bacterium]|nr:GNAT family N-acetyltransferase [Alphaproteobacteria bacterium]
MLKIRPATEKDTLAITTINVLGWKQGYSGLMPNSILDAMVVNEKRIERMKEVISSAEICLVAEDESKVVGFLTGGKTRNKDIPYPYEIYVFYVHPDHWRAGIGTALMQAFKKKIKGAPFGVYMLDGNERALNFYQKMGGIRCPKFDCDTEINHTMIHDIFLKFEGEND